MTENVRTETALTLSYVDCSTLSQASLQQVLARNSVLFAATRALVRRAAARVSLRLCVMEIGKAALELRRREGLLTTRSFVGRGQELISFRSMLKAKARAKTAAKVKAAKEHLVVEQLDSGPTQSSPGTESSDTQGRPLPTCEQRSVKDLMRQLSFWTQRDEPLEMAEHGEREDGAKASKDTEPVLLPSVEGPGTVPGLQYVSDGSEITSMLRMVLARLERVESLVEQGFEDTGQFALLLELMMPMLSLGICILVHVPHARIATYHLHLLAFSAYRAQCTRSTTHACISRPTRPRSCQS